MQRSPGSRKVLLSVSARDPDASVVEVRIDWADGRGVFAGTSCALLEETRPGAHSGRTITFRRIPHTFPKLGRYRIAVRALSQPCPKTGEPQVGPVAHKTLTLRSR